MDLFFQRMAKNTYLTLNEIKPKGTTGRKSAEWRAEQWEKAKAKRKLQRWVDKLSERDLALRNFLLEAYHLELEVSTGMNFSDLNAAKKLDGLDIEHIKQLDMNSNIISYAQILNIMKAILELLKSEHKTKQIKQYKNIIAEYELLQAITNKRERMAEIKRRAKMGGQKIE